MIAAKGWREERGGRDLAFTSTDGYTCSHCASTTRAISAGWVDRWWAVSTATTWVRSEWQCSHTSRRARPRQKLRSPWTCRVGKLRRCDPGPYPCLSPCLGRAAIATPRVEIGICLAPALFTGCVGDTHETACENRESQRPCAIHLLLLLP